jgi:predicted secreted Zn-dependent protease
MLTTAQAEPRISIDLQHYSIQGGDRSSIRREIASKGPVGKNGKRYHAYTQWNIEWGYRWIESSGKCRIQQSDVEVKIDMLLPRLEAGQRDEELQIAWENYYDALLHHEQWHRDFGISAAREIEHELNSIDGWLACDRLEEVVNRRANDVLQHYAEEERRFDERTDHGASDGVVLP